MTMDGWLRGYDTLEAYRAKWGRLSRREFLEEHPYPVLLHTASGVAQAPGEFFTQVAAPNMIRAAQEAPTTDTVLIVIPIRKRPGGAFPERIGVGRARNSDVSLLLAGISKYHAYFCLAPDGVSYMLADADSKNGTFIDSKRLPPKTPTEVHDAALITFAEYHFRYQTAKSTYSLLM